MWQAAIKNLDVGSNEKGQFRWPFYGRADRI